MGLLRSLLATSLRTGWRPIALLLSIYLSSPASESIITESAILRFTGFIPTSGRSEFLSDKPASSSWSYSWSLFFYLQAEACLPVPHNLSALVQPILAFAPLTFPGTSCLTPSTLSENPFSSILSSKKAFCSSFQSTLANTCQAAYQVPFHHTQYQMHTHW